MKDLAAILILTLVTLMTSCSKGKLEEKGFQVNSMSESNETEQDDGLHKDSIKFETRPSNVLLTGIPNVRLATIYKVNFNKKSKTTFIGSNSFHNNYRYEDSETGNNWNNNLMPGIRAVYGYNMVNV